MSFSVRFGQIFFTLRKKTFQQFSIICVVRVQKVLEEKIPWENFPLISFDLEQKVSRLLAIFLRRALHKTVFSFLEQSLGGKNCQKMKSSLIFLRFPSGRISRLRPNYWSSLFKTAFTYTYPEKNFGGTWIQKSLVLYFYSVGERKHFVLWVKTFNSLLKTASNLYRRLFLVCPLDFGDIRPWAI